MVGIPHFIPRNRASGCVPVRPGEDRGADDANGCNGLRPSGTGCDPRARFPKPCAEVRVLPGAPSSTRDRGCGTRSGARKIPSFIPRKGLEAAGGVGEPHGRPGLRRVGDRSSYPGKARPSRETRREIRIDSTRPATRGDPVAAPGGRPRRRRAGTTFVGISIWCSSPTDKRTLLDERDTTRFGLMKARQTPTRTNPVARQPVASMSHRAVEYLWW